MNIINRKAFSVIELLVCILIIVMFIYVAINLIIHSSHLFTKHEGANIAAFEASMIVSSLRRDLSQMISSDNAATIESLGNVFSQNGNTTKLKIDNDGSVVLIEYDYDPEKQLLVRKFGSKVQYFARDKLVNFRIDPLIMDDKGNILSSEQIKDLSDTTLINRFWTKVTIEIDTDEKQADSDSVLVRNYEFKIFPLRYNRQIQSIWRR